MSCSEVHIDIAEKVTAPLYYYFQCIQMIDSEDVPMRPTITATAVVNQKDSKESINKENTPLMLNAENTSKPYVPVLTRYNVESRDLPNIAMQMVEDKVGQSILFHIVFLKLPFLILRTDFQCTKID